MLMWRRLFLFLCLLPLAACLSTSRQPHTPVSFEAKVTSLAEEIKPGNSVAVSWFYDQGSGDVTALGNQWRDRTEAALKKAGLTVKVRQEIGFLIDDVESFGLGRRESDIWKEAGADIVLSCGYLITSSDSPKIDLTIKAIRADDVSLVQTVGWSESLAGDWPQLAADIRGNVYQSSLASIVGEDSKAPALAAELDRSPACYPAGATASVTTTTEPGTHLYILNLAADHTVTLVYPNSRLTDQPLPSGSFVFPPPALGQSLQMQLHPLQPGRMSHESFKIVASRVPLDFSFLPVPENEIFSGLKGGDIKKMLTVLTKNTGWSQQTLTYWVGPECH